jgi:hypothetical protein
MWLVLSFELIFFYYKKFRGMRGYPYTKGQGKLQTFCTGIYKEIYRLLIKHRIAGSMTRTPVGRHQLLEPYQLNQPVLAPLNYFTIQGFQ